MRSFISTRGGEATTLEEALFRGLAPDGGLYVPEHLGRLPGVPPLDGSLVDVARWAAPTLVPDVEPAVLDRVVVESLTFPIPLVEVERGIHVLELFHGPTHAFKDVGARFLARLASALDPGGRVRTVLVATSGDTGGAVAGAFHRVPGFRVVVLFPRDGISSRQRHQMTTLGDNVLALAVEGTFDDCQRMAKAAFLDEALADRFALTSANSINVGRLLPQALYYVYAAARLGWAERPARYIVPSGNLGNLCAGLVARRIGMPARSFVAASNDNRGFVDFLNGAPYRARPSVSTSSSAMDVGDPSNLERLLWLHDSDADALRARVSGRAVSESEARSCMRDVFERTGYVLDPHAAVAYAARGDSGGDDPTVVLATAHPAKFPDVTEQVTGRDIPIPEDLARLMDAPEHMVDVAATPEALADTLATLDA